ncbi:hypothetical protein QYS36_19185 [Pseudomonas sp. G34]|uniref:hypothetical protein n=1 Tax=Pseudomonas sp. G34 TaxID=3059083 RepID=UPI002806BC72|nr:hypothetical protein [Pseudomonas sp. G34]MDQ7987069.1 hypothetical protein [Pseudomonas sp. G34]
MSFYHQMAAMALDMITEYGQLVTLRNLQQGEYDPEASAPAPPVAVEHDVQGLLLEYSGREFEASSLILTGDKKLKIPAQGLAWVPSLGSKAVIQGVEWTIVPPVKEVNPAGTPILYELQVRR